MTADWVRMWSSGPTRAHEHCPLTRPVGPGLSAVSQRRPVVCARSLG